MNSCTIRKLTKAGSIPAMLGVCLLLGACNWMYFHDDEYEKQAKLTLDSVKVLDASKDIGAFDKRLNELQQQYEVARTDMLLATRDREIALVLTGNPIPGSDALENAAGGVAYLNQKVWERLTQLTGVKEGPNSTAELKSWTDLDIKVRRAQRQIVGVNDEVVWWRSKYAEMATGKEKKRDLSCVALVSSSPGAAPQVELAPDLPQALKNRLDLLLKHIWRNCQEYSANYQELPTELAAYLETTETAWVAQNPLPQGGDPCRSEDLVRLQAEAMGNEVMGTADSEIKVLSANYRALLMRQARWQQCQKTINKRLEQLNNELAGKKPGEPAPAENGSDLSSTVKEISSLLEKAPAEIKVDGLETMIEALDSLASVDLKKLANGEESEIKIPASCSDKTKAAEPICIVPAVLTVVQKNVVTMAALDKLPPEERLASILKELSGLRLKLALAQADASVEKSRKAIIEARFQAAAAEVAALVTASEAIRTANAPNDGTDLMDVADRDTRRQLGFALAIYSASWENGRIPARLLDIREIRLTHYKELARDVAFARWSKQTIDEAVAAVHAYAQGGIEIDDLLELLAHLGIIAALAT